MVEEIHEYIPEGGGLDETGQMLVRVAKRGRKRGLGLAGISQRPADVKKDVITQANLLVWHRLTWENDTTVVRRVVSKDVADAVGDVADGEAFVLADWREADVEHVQFRRKQTFDAGATPGLEDVDRPELKSIGADLLEELEVELENQENIASAAQQMADALRGADDEAAADVPEDFDAQLAEKNQRIQELERERDELADRVDELEGEVERLQVAADRIEQAEQIETQLEQAWDGRRDAGRDRRG